MLRSAGPMLSCHINQLKIDNTRAQPRTRRRAANDGRRDVIWCFLLYRRERARLCTTSKRGAMKDLVRIRDQFCVSVSHTSGLQININQ